MNPLAIYGIIILIVVLFGAQATFGGILFYSEKIKTFARAIGGAEGFGIPGAIPTQAHNPGDLVLGDLGYGTLGSEQITILQDDNVGWDKLYHQLNLIVNGHSHVYNLEMTIYEMAQKWTSTQPDAWANNVSRALGVPVNTPLSSLLV